jgi:cytoplasmic iron level regulating protein YaaA (DUF328/UPF0246 family)
MLILLSPAKTLDMETPSSVATPSVPLFLEDSSKLVATLKRYPKTKLSRLMRISESLAELNAQRFAAWHPDFDADNARPCIQAFRGDVYVGMDADTLTEHDLDFAQRHVRILSGLYGILRPLDLMQAYRLEMGTPLKTRRGTSLYAFWGERLTKHLNNELHSMMDPLVVNLASNEYFKSVHQHRLESPLCSPVFKDEKNGEYKVISFFAKRARGAMARHLVQSRATGLDAVLAFDGLGYRYDKRASSEGQPVFLRSMKAAQPYLA